MSTGDNVGIIQEFFAATGRGDERSLVALCSEDIEWVIPGEWAWAGTHRGHAGLISFLKQAPETVEITASELGEFVAQGDRVIVFGVAKGKVKATDKSFEDHFVFDFTVRNGQVTKIREYIDTLALARASEATAKSKENV